MRMPELLSTLMRSVGMAQADTQSPLPASSRQRAFDTCRSKHPRHRPKSNEVPPLPSRRPGTPRQGSISASAPTSMRCRRAETPLESIDKGEVGSALCRLGSKLNLKPSSHMRVSRAAARSFSFRNRWPVGGAQHPRSAGAHHRPPCDCVSVVHPAAISFALALTAPQPWSAPSR